MNSNEGANGLDDEPSCSGQPSGGGSSSGGDEISTSLDELDSQLAALLADDAEVLARDGTLEAPSARLDPAVRARLMEARACLGLLKRAWPRGELSEIDEGPDPGAGTDPGREGDGPRKIGRFTILGELGHGGFGIVYLAQDPALGRQVALKLPRLEALVSREMRRRFLAEARVAARLDHPNIVPIYDVGELGDGRGPSAIYIASAYCREGPLSAWIDRQGSALAPHRIARLMIGLAEGVQHLHDLGIIHRDLKPSNVLLQRRTGGTGAIGSGRDSGTAGERPGSAEDPEADYIPRVADFGLARLLDQPIEQTLSGVPIGSPPFMSPEQARGQVRALGPSTDVYGLGAILYVLLTGRPPFRGETTTETIRQVIHDEPIPPRRLRRGLPRDMETICLTCLHKEPARRYSSASALRDDLAHFLRGEPIRARPVSVGEYVVKWAIRRPTTATLLALLAVTMVVGSAIVLEQWRHAIDLNDQLSRSLEKSVRSEDELRRQVYLEKMNRAAREWENGNLGQVRKLLDETKPELAHSDLRSFEWFHLDGLAHGDEIEVRGHTGAVWDVTFSPDGKLMASSGQDHTIRIWDTIDGRHVRTLDGAPRLCEGIAFRPDGKTLAGGATDGIIRIWDIATGRFHALPKAHTARIASIAFSPNGHFLASAGQDKKIIVWDAESGRPLHTLSGHELKILSLAFSADNTTLASSGLDGRIMLWDAAAGRALRELERQVHPVRRVLFGHDGKILVTAVGDGVIKFWDLETNSIIHSLPRNRGTVMGIALSPDGKWLASAGDDQIVTLWDVARGEVLRIFRGHANAITNVAFSPDGRRIASAGSDDNSARIWDAARTQGSRILTPHAGPINGVACSPDGKQIASTHDDGIVRLWDVESSLLVRSFKGHVGAARQVIFSPDGKTLATSGIDRKIQIWDPATGKLIRRLPEHPSALQRLAFSPDGKDLAVIDDRPGRTVRLLSVVTGRVSREFRGGDEGSLNDLAFSPDGSRLVAGASNGLVIIWDVNDRRRLLTLSGHSDRVFSVAISRDGRRLATGGFDALIKLWDLETGALIQDLRGHRSRVYDVAFSPDGTRLVSAGADRLVRLWDTSLGRECSLPQVGNYVIQSLEFSPYGQRLVASDQDGLIHFWETNSSRSYR